MNEPAVRPPRSTEQQFRRTCKSSSEWINRDYFSKAVHEGICGKFVSRRTTLIWPKYHKKDLWSWYKPERSVSLSVLRWSLSSRYLLVILWFLFLWFHLPVSRFLWPAMWFDKATRWRKFLAYNSWLIISNDHHSPKISAVFNLPLISKWWRSAWNRATQRVTMLPHKFPKSLWIRLFVWWLRTRGKSMLTNRL